MNLRPESFVDECAAASAHPLSFRLPLLAEPRQVKNPLEPNSPPLDTRRFRGLLELAGRGMAAHYSFRTYVAHVAEVSVEADGTVRVERLVTAVDCGPVVNPDGVRAEMEGGIVYGLTAALRGEITIANGSVRQSNFHDYPMLRINEMPKVEVHLESPQPLHFLTCVRMEP